MWRGLLSLLIALTFGAVAMAQTPAGGPSVPAATGAASDGLPEAPTTFDYRLGADDKVRIIVFGEDSLTGEFTVSGGSGTIAFPLIGDVQAGGLTITELQKEIEDKLRDGFLKEPRVSIEVLNYRPYRKYYAQ